MAGLPNAVFETFADLYDLLTQQPWWDRQIEALVHLLGELPEGARVLDLGCGPGVSALVAARLRPGLEVVGVDLSERMIQRARAHLDRTELGDRVRFLRADATALPFEEGHFHAAMAHSFLYLVPDRPAVLRECRRVLAPGAPVAMMEPDIRGSLLTAAPVAARSLGELARHPWDTGRFAASMVAWRAWGSLAERPSPEALVSLFEGAGFHQVRTEPTLATLGLHVVATNQAPLPPSAG